MTQIQRLVFQVRYKKTNLTPVVPEGNLNYKDEYKLNAWKY